MKLSLLGAAFALCACTGSPNPQTVAAVGTAGADFAVCVLGQFAQCEAANTPWPTCTVQILAACGGDAVQIGRVVDASHKAALAASPTDAGTDH